MFTLARYNVVCTAKGASHRRTAGQAELAANGTKLFIKFQGRNWTVRDVRKGLSGTCLAFDLVSDVGSMAIYTDMPVSDVSPERIRGIAYETARREVVSEYIAWHYASSLADFGEVDSQTFAEDRERLSQIKCSGA